MQAKHTHGQTKQTKKTTFFEIDLQGRADQTRLLALQFVTETNDERQNGVSYDERP